MATQTRLEKLNAMANLRTNAPYRATIPEGYVMGGRTLWLVPVMALGAFQRYGNKPLTSAQWRVMLQRMRYAPHLITRLADELEHRYPAPLSVDEWADLFEQLVFEHVLATKYPHLQ